MAQTSTRKGDNGRRHLRLNIVVKLGPEGADGRVHATILENQNVVGHGGYASFIGDTGAYEDVLVKTAYWLQCQMRILRMIRKNVRRSNEAYRRRR